MHLIQRLLYFLVLICSLGTAMPGESDDILLFSFYRENGLQGTYLAYSEDGVRFIPLNNDQPVLVPPKWQSQSVTRDPSMVYHDGKFCAVWMTSLAGQIFGYAESNNLIHWSDPIEVHPFPDILDSFDQPNNIWSPQIQWDPFQNNYLILWATSTPRTVQLTDGSNNSGKWRSDNHRIYFSRTVDGRHFSSAALFFDPHFSCVDAQMALDPHDSSDPVLQRWAMVLKDEQDISLGGKNIRLTWAPADLSTGFHAASAPILGPGSSISPKEVEEGPCLVKWKGRWLLYADGSSNGHYFLLTSLDLRTWNNISADLKMPPHPRHGTVFIAPRSAVGWLSPHGNRAVNN